MDIASLLVTGGIVLWFLAGIGLMVLPTSPVDQLLGLYLVALQAAAYYGYRRLQERGLEDGVTIRGSLPLLVPVLLSFNMLSLVGLGILYVKGMMPKPRPIEYKLQEQPRARQPGAFTYPSTVKSQAYRTRRTPMPAATSRKPQRTPVPQPHAIGTRRDYSRLLGVKLKGTLTGLGCGEEFKTCIGEVVLTEYHGCWDVCLLGCGGWGCAFKASRNGVTVVFKIPRGLEQLLKSQEVPTVSEDVVKRVMNEAKTIKALRHPHLLNLLGYGRSIPLLVYEYADGGNIPWQISGGWRPGVDTIALIGVQLGDALRYIHTRGLIHGDVKPANVFIVDGIVKLGDFSGLTRLLGQVSVHSWSYTPGWRAPEQVYSDLRARAIERGLENRIDVYQLGNLLLYLLTRRNIDGEEALKPGVLNSAINKIQNRHLARIISLMMRPAPWERPSMDEAVINLASIP
ncbi:MAG: protein kinase [Desulfurococcales archaeon]|nr:protein kinase [Desulfurococcales archaeon]